MNQIRWPHITRFGLYFLVALLILLAGCSTSSEGNKSTPNLGASPITSTSTASVSATSTRNTPTPNRTSTTTPTPNTPPPTREVTKTPTPIVPTWSVSPNGNNLQIDYGSGASFPQYGALDVTSGYFRLNYGPGSG